MPITRTPNSEESQWYQSQGIDPNTVEITIGDDGNAEANFTKSAQEQSYSKTIVDTLKAHTGGLVGGGAGALAGAKYGALAGAAIPIAGETGIPELIGGVGGGIVGGLIGSLGGQKTQQAIEPTATYEAQQQAARESAQANPKTALATDVISSALTSGGRPSLNALRSVRGLIGALRGAAINETDKDAIKQTVLNSAINPAINSGINYATTGQLPSLSDVASQSIGGVVFSKQANWASKLIGQHRPITDEPLPEVSNSDKLQLDTDLGLKTKQEVPVDTVSPIDQFIAKQSGDEQRSLWTDKLAEEQSIKSSETESAGSEEQIIPRTTTSNILKQEKQEEQIAAPSRPQVETQEDLQKQLQDELNKTSVNSPLSDYNRYTELTKQLEGKSLDESQPLMKEIEDIKNRNNGNPPKPFPENNVLNPVVLQAYIMSGRATTGSVLEHLATTQNHPMQELAKELLDNSDTKSLGVKWSHNPALDKEGVARSHYDTMTDQVNIGTGSAGDSRVVLEEAIHSMTSKKIPYFAGQGAEHYNRLNTYLKTGSNLIVKDLIQSYFYTAKSLGIHRQLFEDTIGPTEQIPVTRGFAGNADEVVKGINGFGTSIKYAMGNLDEFIAQALKDPQFQRVLDGIKTTDGRTVMQKIVDAIRNLLGLSPKAGSMLDRVVRSSGALIKQDRPESKFRETRFDKDGNVISDKQFAPPKDNRDEHGIPVDPKQPLWNRIVTKLRAANDSVRAIGTSNAIKLADALDNTAKTTQKYKAHGETALWDLRKYNPELVNGVKEKHREAWRNDVEPRFKSKEEKEISNIFTHYYHDQIGQERRTLGMTINNRKAGLNKYYVPDTMNEDVINTFTKHSQGERAAHLKGLWADYIVKESKGGIDRNEALEGVNTYISALGSPSTHYNSVKFSAIRKAEGFGLPEGMREVDASKSLNKYSNRASADLAVYKHLESDREVAGMLKLRDPKTGLIPSHEGEGADLSQDNSVRSAMQWVTGSFKNSNHPALTAVIRAANNGILGLGTGIRDLIQVPVNMIPYINSIRDIGPILKGLADFRSNARQSLEIGATRPTIDKIRFNQLGDSVNSFTAGAQKLGDLLRKWQGREVMENWARDMTFSVGKELTKQRIIEAKSGNVKAAKWLDRFGTIVEGDITKLEGKKLEDAIAQTAKNFVDANQGAYDQTGLPTGIVDSQLAPFLSLQKWSVEKANTIYKDVYLPFKSGENRLPLLTYTLGSIITGAGIQEINKLLNNRKGSDPEVKEALESESPHAIASELAALLSLSSFGGVVGDALKFGSDISNSKAPRSPLAFPLATATADFVTKTAYVIQAINEGEEPMNVLGQFATDLMTHNIQSARMLANRTINDEKVENADKFRDLRVFNELEGKSAAQIPNVNPYLNLEAKDFKHAKSLDDSVAMLPSLIQKAFTKANGDSFELKRQLDALKSNSYQTMPNFETTPLSFIRYLNFLKNTQGEQAAQDRLMNYITQNQVNRIKSSVVP